MRFRLAVLASHAICYHAMLFRRLAKHPKIDLTVYYYCPDFGLTEQLDPGFGIAYKWDTPVLEGYKYKFLRNYSPSPGFGKFWGFINLGILSKLIREDHDAVLIHGYMLASDWLGFVGSWLTRTPAIFKGETLLRPNPSRKRRIAHRMLARLLFPRIKAFLPIGTKSREFYRYHGIPDGRLFLTPYSVDNDFFAQGAREWRPRRNEVKESLGLPAEMPVVLSTMKLIPRKRPLDLIQAFERLRAPAGLVLVGGGELQPMLSAYVQEKNIKNVLFAGFQNQGELSRYYSIGDIFVLPSSYEPWGLVINEAMCFGLPIITTDNVAASVDLVHPGENGVIYRPGDVDALTSALEELLRDPEKRQRMGQRSRQTISGWNQDTCVEGIVQALEFVTMSDRKGR